MLNIKVFVKVFFSMIILLIILPIAYKAYAVDFNNSKSIYDAVKASGGNIIYDSGYIYYATGDTASTAQRQYDTAGATIQVKKYDNTWSRKIATPFGAGLFESLPSSYEVVNGRTWEYSAYKASIANISARIPDAANEISDPNFNLTFKFDFPVMITLSGLGNWLGGISADGTYWGWGVYQDADSAWSAVRDYGIGSSEATRLNIYNHYNVEFLIEKSAKSSTKSYPGMFDKFEYGNEGYKLSDAEEPYIPYEGSTDRWYKRGSVIQLDNVVETHNSTLYRAYFMLYNAANKSRDVREFIEFIDQSNAWGGSEQTIDGAYTIVSSRMHGDNGSSNTLRRFQLAFKVWDDRDILFYGNGANSHYILAAAESTMGIDSNRRIRIDGVGPKGSVSLDSTSTVNNKVIKVSNLVDQRTNSPSIQIDDSTSGVKESTVRVNVKESGSYTYLIKDKFMSKQNDGSYKLDIPITSDYMKYKFGTFTAEVYASDNVGNDAKIGSINFDIDPPNPINGKLEMKKYDFQEYNDANNNGKKDAGEEFKEIYWVKPESEFGIYTDGYIPSNYNIFPTTTYVLYAKDGVFDLSNSPRQYADEYGQSTFGSDYNKYFYSIGWEPATFKKQDDKNYISNTHLAQVKEDRYGKIDKFKLYYTNTYWFKDKEYYDKYVDSGKWLNIDGIAPTGNGLVEIDYKTLNMTITANDIKDDGSGVDSVWAMIFPYDSYSDYNADIDDFQGTSEYKNDEVMERKLNRKANGEYSLTLNAYDDAFKSEMVKVVICAKDNVGNKSIIKEENIDLFTLKARIVPLNNMDYSSTNPPTLEEGQAAVLIMEVTGEVESLDIEFPYKLYDMDNTLDKTITLDPLEKYKRVDNNFIVPLYCENGRYTVEVVAHRKGKERYASPEFIVSDSVLNGIKTRIR